jgi:hypothetical protein
MRPLHVLLLNSTRIIFKSTAVIYHESPIVIYTNNYKICAMKLQRLAYSIEESYQVSTLIDNP